MGEADRYSEYSEKRNRGLFSFNAGDNALLSLVIINIVLFIILSFIRLGYVGGDSTLENFNLQVLKRFAFPADVNTLIKQPWSVITYMFSDVSVMRIIVNMIWLWGFGSMVQNISGTNKLVPVYLYGGLIAAVVFIAAAYAIPSLRPTVPTLFLLGANAPILAVAGAATAFAPQHRFFQQLGGGIPLWVLLVVFILIDFASFRYEGTASVLAHLAAVGVGIGFVVLLRRGYDPGLWMHSLYRWFVGLFNPEKYNSKTPTRERVFYETGSRKPYKKRANVTQQRVDEILDKINQKGYQYLTEEEKNILKRASEDDAL